MLVTRRRASVCLAAQRELPGLPPGPRPSVARAVHKLWFQSPRHRSCNCLAPLTSFALFGLPVPLARCSPRAPSPRRPRET